MAKKATKKTTDKPTKKPSGKPSTFLRYEQLLDRANGELLRVRDLKAPRPGHARYNDCWRAARDILNIIEDILGNLGDKEFED